MLMPGFGIACATGVLLAGDPLAIGTRSSSLGLDGVLIGAAPRRLASGGVLPPAAWFALGSTGTCWWSGVDALKLAGTCGSVVFNGGGTALYLMPPFPELLLAARLPVS